MSDQATFLKAICADPADPLPREIYCDWLEENAKEGKCPECVYGAVPTDRDDNTCGRCAGSGWASNGFAERAEFIRLQLRLAEVKKNIKLEPDPDCENLRCRAMRQEWQAGRQLDPVICASCWTEYTNLHYRKSQLLTARGGMWALEFCRAADIDVRGEEGSRLSWDGVTTYSERDRTHPTYSWRFRWRGGFIEEVEADWDPFNRHAERIRAATPLRRVVLTTRPVLSQQAMTGPEPYRFYLPGRSPVRHRDLPGNLIITRESWADPAVLLAVLRATFPGLEFEVKETRPLGWAVYYQPPNVPPHPGFLIQ